MVQEQREGDGAVAVEALDRVVRGVAERGEHRPPDGHEPSDHAIVHPQVPAPLRRHVLINLSEMSSRFNSQDLLVARREQYCSHEYTCANDFGVAAPFDSV